MAMPPLTVVKWGILSGLSVTEIIRRVEVQDPRSPTDGISELLVQSSLYRTDHHHQLSPRQCR